MKFSKLFVLNLLLLFQTTLYAQTFEVPKNYELKVAADYSKYEKDVIDASKWLKATPLNEQAEKRKEVSKFIFEWVQGSPTVNVEFYGILMDFEKKNPGMLAIYMASSSKYALENNYSKNNPEKYKAALLDMIYVYKGGNGITKDKKMEKLIKSVENGKIDEWIAENFKN
jgi:hypothetical protein